MNPPTHSSKVAASVFNVWRRHIWLRPLIILVTLASVGWAMREKVESALKANLRSVLETTLATEETALRNWMRIQRNQAEFAATDARVLKTIQALIAGLPENATSLQILNLPQTAELREQLAPIQKSQKYDGILVVEPSGRVLAATRDELVGRVIPDEQLTQLREKVFAGHSMLLSPYKSTIILEDRHGMERAGVPTMFVIAPVVNEGGEVIAALGLRIRPEVEFTRILETARLGETGETYAFSRDGMMLSNSRFDEQLRGIGLLSDREDSTLNISLRDPGVDLTGNARPKQPRSEQPPTYPVAEAAAGRDGVNVNGYRDYRGVSVVGAWKWLPEVGFGLIAEVDISESHQTLTTINHAFWSMFALLGIATLAMLFSMRRADRLAEQARRDAIELKRLGQYTLEDKLGEGGMGVVYRARHAMLHRPTAVKFLETSRTNEMAIARFEREVQLTSRLNHPNTIAIYDYGRTPEGVFYYAMEYLEGIDLQDLVDLHGPQPEGRVIHILKQVSGSLAEAHSIGLIHRDVKPANILLNVRGGLFDFVKLLDFGLVKAAETSRAALVTQAGGVVGTPHYMSPEAYKSPDKVDGRSDLYAVGAVGYFLLTATPLFIGDYVLDILNQQSNTPPEPPSQRLGQPVSPELERLLMRCLSKAASDRPASAEEIIAELVQIPTAGSWTDADARAWWRRYRPTAIATPPPKTATTEDLAATVIVDQRSTDT